MWVLLFLVVLFLDLCKCVCLRARQYTKSHYDINPKAITPMGPIPDIESGVEADWSKVKPGGVHLPKA